MDNRRSLSAFLTDYAYWSFMGLLFYRTRLFRALPGCSLHLSKLVFWGLFLLFTLIGLLSTWRMADSRIATLVNLLGLFDVYTLLSYRTLFPVAFAVTVAVSLLVAFLLAMRALQFRKYHEKGQSLPKLLFRSRDVATLLCAVAITPMLISVFFGNSLIRISVPATSGRGDYLEMVHAHFDDLQNLNEGTWQHLSTEERADTLQTVANIERAYLGIPHELNVNIFLCGDYTLGDYNPAQHSIQIDSINFEGSSPAELLETLTHECYHAYQYMLCELYGSLDEQFTDLMLFADVPYYLEEFSNYQDGSGAFSDYYDQRCEVRARQYAEQAVERYSAYIA